MKKFLLLTFLLLTAVSAKAQLVTPEYEMTTTKNWTITKWHDKGYTSAHSKYYMDNVSVSLDLSKDNKRLEVLLMESSTKKYWSVIEIFDITTDDYKKYEVSRLHWTAQTQDQYARCKQRDPSHGIDNTCSDQLTAYRELFEVCLPFVDELPLEFQRVIAQWIKANPKYRTDPFIDSVSGNIVRGQRSDLRIEGSGFKPSSVEVLIIQGGKCSKERENCLVENGVLTEDGTVTKTRLSAVPLYMNDADDFWVVVRNTRTGKKSNPEKFTVK